VVGALCGLHARCRRRSQRGLFLTGACEDAVEFAVICQPLLGMRRGRCGVPGLLLRPLAVQEVGHSLQLVRRGGVGRDWRGGISVIHPVLGFKPQWQVVRGCGQADAGALLSDDILDELHG